MLLVPLYVCVVYSRNLRFLLLHGLPAFWAWCVVEGAPLCTEMTTAQPLESSRQYTTA
jgi:hypothetical protein